MPRARRTRAREVLRPVLFLGWAALVWVAWAMTDRFAGDLLMLRSIPRQIAFPWPHAGAAIPADLWSVVAAFLVCAIAADFGRRALSFARVEAGWLTRLGVGVPLVALVAHGGGLVGLAFPRVIAAMVAGAGVLAVRSMWRAPVRIARSLAMPGRPWSLRWPVWIAAGVAGLAAFVPQLSWDAQVHHIRAPELWLLDHKIHAIPRMPHAFFPATGETIFMVAKAIGGDPAAALVHVALWLACGAAVARIARMTWGGAAGPWAQVLFASLPLGIVLASRAYVEFLVVFPILVCYMMLAGRRPPGPAALCVAGWLAGAAFGAKYQGGFPAAVLAAFALWRTRDKPWRAPAFAAAGLLCAFPWLARSWVWTGNPVFPVLWGGLGWTAYDSRGISQMLISPIRETLGHLLTGLLGAGADDGGYTPMLLGAVLVPVMWRQARKPALWAIILAMTIIWVISAPHPRFLIPAAALACAAAAGVVRGYGLPSSVARVFPAVTLTGAWVSIGLGLGAIQYTAQPYAVAVGRITPAEYREIRSSPPGFVETIDDLPRIVPPSGRVYVIGHMLTHGLARRSWFDFTYLRPPLWWWIHDAGTPRRIYVRARQAGLTHLAVNPYGTWVIFGRNPDLMNWTPAMLKAYRGFWVQHAELVRRVAAWRIYRIVPSVSRRPADAAHPPGSEGAPL